MSLRQQALTSTVAALRARQARLAEVMSFALAAAVLAEQFGLVVGRAQAADWCPLTSDVPASSVLVRKPRACGARSVRDRDGSPKGPRLGTPRLGEEHDSGTRRDCPPPTLARELANWDGLYRGTGNRVRLRGRRPSVGAKERPICRRATCAVLRAAETKGFRAVDFFFTPGNAPIRAFCGVFRSKAEISTPTPGTRRARRPQVRERGAGRIKNIYESNG